MEPAALIVAGSWHLPEHYSAVATSLQQSGFTTVRNPKLLTAVEKLPIPPDATLSGDTELIRSELASLADSGHAITILCHSYGGVLTSNSVDGFLLPQRKAAGKAGGVVHIIYMAAFVLPPGTGLSDSFGGNIPEWLRPDEENNILYIDDHRMSFYNDLPDAEAQKWADKCVYCSLNCWDKLTNTPPYEAVGKGLDATYLVCQRDYRLPVVVQEGMATMLGEERRMVYIDKGHCPMVSAPGEVAEVVWGAWEVSRRRLERD